MSKRSKLVHQYLALHKGKTEAAKDLKTNAGCELARAYEWIDPHNKRDFPKYIETYMRYQVTKWVVDAVLNSNISQDDADKIADNLS